MVVARVILLSSTAITLAFGDDVMSILQGYSAVSGEPRPNMAVHGTNVTSKVQSHEFLAHVVTSKYELAKSMGIEAQAIFKNTAFKANAKLTFFQQMDVKSTYVSMVVSGSRTVEKQSTTNVHLKKLVKPPTTDAELKTWFNKNGDTFVSHIDKGAQFYAVWIFKSETKAMQENLYSKIKATGLTGKGDTLSGGFSSNMSKLSKESNVDLTFYQSGFGINVNLIEDAKPDGSGKEDVGSFLTKFLKTKLKGPEVVSYDLDSYASVRGMENSAFRRIDQNRKMLQGEEPGQVGGLALQYVKVDEKLAEATQIKDRNQELVSTFVDEGLEKVIKQTDQDKSAIENLRTVYLNDPVKKLEEPKLPSLGMNIKAVLPSFIEWKLAGPAAGPKYIHNDMTPTNLDDSYRKGWRPTAFNCRVGRGIDSVCGYFHTNTGKKQEDCYGWTSKPLQQPFNLGNGQWTTQVTIWWNRAVVEGLEFQRNDGEKQKYGRGKEYDKAYSEQIQKVSDPKSCLVYGFKAAHGGWMDKLVRDFGIIEACLKKAEITLV